MSGESNKAQDRAGCVVNRGPGGVMERALFRGFTYTANLFNNKTDYLSWCLNRGDVPIDRYHKSDLAREFPTAMLLARNAKPVSRSVSTNLITTQGKNLDNDVMFGATAKVTPWYVLIFNTNTTILATHTYQIPGFTEDVDYDEAAVGRPEYTDAPSAAGVMTNIASRAVFTITTGGQTIYGAGLVGGPNAQTAGNTAATNYLYSASLFGSSHAVLATNVLSVDISITRT